MKNKLKKLVVLSAVTALVSTSVMGVSAATLKNCFKADYYSSAYADLKEAFGNDEEALYKHYKEYGVKEGRQANQYFDVKTYRERYADLDAAFGDDWDAYYNHYINYGLYEGRSAVPSGEVFRADVYAELNPDLKEAFGDNVLALLESVSNVEEKCAAYEYTEWAWWDYETAYKMTTADGTVAGIIVYSGEDGWEINAFVSYTKENGFDYIDPGDHYVSMSSKGWYNYIKGNELFLVDSADSEPRVVEMTDDETVTVWHM